jgi:hypothetical protein
MFLKLCWIVTLLMTTLAACIYIFGMADANSAPQQAAAAASALAASLIPYIFTRCIEKLSRPKLHEVKVTNWPERE